MPPEGSVGTAIIDIAGTAVVRQEHEERVVGEAEFFEFGRDRTDIVVYRCHHGRIDPRAVLLDVAVAVQVFLRGLQRSVRRVRG